MATTQTLGVRIEEKDTNVYLDSIVNPISNTSNLKRRRMRIFIFLLFTLYTYSIFSQNLDWSIHIGDNVENQSLDMEISPNGKVYFLGVSEPGSMDINPNGSPVIFTSTLSNTDGETFVAKYNANSTLEWWFSLEKNNNWRERIAIDSSENLYYFGTFFGTQDFDPGSGVVELTSSGGSSDWFLSKYDTDGNFQWVVDITTDYDLYHIPKIFTDSLGCVYTHLYGENILRKFSSNGNLLWEYSANGTPAFNGSDRIFWIKDFTEELTYQNNFYGPTSTSLNMIIIDTSGILIDDKQIATSSGGLMSGKLIYDSSGNILINGGFHGTWNFIGLSATHIIENYAEGWIGPNTWGPFSREFMVKTDLDGNVKWAKQQSYPSSGGSPSPRWIITDTSGTIYSIGQGYGKRNFDWNDSTALSTEKLVFIAKYDSSFNYMGCNTLLHQGLTGSPLRNIILKADTLYVACTFYADLTPGFNNSGSSVDNNGSYDILIAKYSDFLIDGYPAAVEQMKGMTENMLVYPNPSNGIFYYVFNSSQKVDISVFDMTGKEVISYRNVNEQLIDLTNHQSGVYILSVNSNGQNQQIKLVRN